jgi:tripeptide aminopeptidase
MSRPSKSPRTSETQPARRPNRATRKGRPTGGAEVELLLRLLAVPGPSGQEAAVSRHVQQILAEAGVSAECIHEDQSHRRSPLVGETGNLIVRLPGNRRGPRRLFVAHLDTVPICVGCEPVVSGHYLRSAKPGTGLGADNRAGCAVLLQTVLTLLRRQLPHPPLTFLWTVQEEVGLQGARLLNLGLLGKPVYGFNWDGGAAHKLTVGATGGYRMQIEVLGKASHAGGAPERGVSAIVAASLAISRLHQDGWLGAVNQSGRVGTSNVGVIGGGSAANVVADRVSVLAEARSHDAAFRRQIVEQIESAFFTAATEIRNVHDETARASFEGRLDYESFCLPTGHPCVHAAERAVRSCAGEPELTVANGGLDANWLTARGIPTVTLGCGQIGQHTADEALDVNEFRQACRIALELATELGL